MNTKSSAIAEALRNVLVIRNLATKKYLNAFNVITIAAIR